MKQLSESQLAVYRYNEKGEREIMDDDARGRERAKVNAFIRDSQVPPRVTQTRYDAYGFFSSIA